MPNRILRDWTDSEPVNLLDPWEERTFTRLIMKADDYGRGRAEAKLLRPMLYPLLLETVREADLERWIAQCEIAGLVRLYDAGGKRYYEILNFKQRTRSPSKFPDPPSGGQVTASGGQVPAQTTTDAQAHAETTTGPPAAASAAERESWAANRSRCWISTECPSFLRSGVSAFSRLIQRLGYDEAVKQVQAVRADPDVGNPFNYLEAKLDNQKAKRETKRGGNHVQQQDK